jgi:hypothetical protein
MRSFWTLPDFFIEKTERWHLKKLKRTKPLKTMESFDGNRPHIARIVNRHEYLLRDETEHAT